jgi:cardiolipin synthase A/B
MAHRRLIMGLSLCLLLGVAGCNSLPSIAPGTAPSSNVSIQLEGARGGLSAAQSKAILDRLKSSSPDTNIFDRHLALEEALTGSPLNAGNRVQLLLDGPATYDAMLSAIATAKDHVNMETYIMDDDDVGRNFAKVLMDKQMQGVQVNLIRDSVGTFGTPSEFFQALIDKGIKVVEFNPINPLVAGTAWSPNRRDHRKLLIVDGSKAFLGGINISSVYSGGSFGKGARNRKDGTLAWRDTDLQLEGPVVAELQKLFLDTWEKQKGGPLPERNYFPPARSVGQTVVRAIGSTPNEPYSQIYAALLSAIGNAETSVYLTNAYFAPDPQLLAALTAAVARGVDVKLILPSQTDSWLVFHAGRGYYTRLLRAGIKIFQLKGAILHSKTALIDGVWATVGSTNLDWRSFLHNQELDAVVLGAEFGVQVQVMFDRDLASSDEILLAQWERRTLDLRFKEFFARMWEYWL